jgi:uncharacterized protein YcfJ
MTANTITTAAMVGALAVAVYADDASAHGNGHGNGHAYGHREATQYVYARVVDVDPIIRYVTVDRPREQCWDEVVRERAEPFGVAGVTAAGGVIGAAIGRQFGSGSSRDALTVIGGVAGAAVAHERAIRNQGYETRDVTVRRCEVVHERVTEEHVDGYMVGYVYGGRHYTMRTPTPPGDRVRLAVDVHPVDVSPGFYRLRY